MLPPMMTTPELFDLVGRVGGVYSLLPVLIGLRWALLGAGFATAVTWAAVRSLR